VLSTFAFDNHHQVKFSTALAWFVGFFTALGGVSYVIYLFAPAQIAVRRTFPYNGLEKELRVPGTAVYLQSDSLTQARKSEEEKKELEE
jgi:hypothetical protein